MTPRNTILSGNAVQVLAGLAAESVDTVVTSPPYFGLRLYGQEPDQLGLEASVDEYVEGLVAVCRQLARVLKPHGALWLNLGDSYSRSKSWGTPSKSLLLAPERLLLSLSRDGWVVRNRIVWSKPNPMPDSARDRLAVAHEDILFLTRGGQYFFDLDAIRVAHTSRTSKPTQVVAGPRVRRGLRDSGHSGMAKMLAEGRVGHPNGRNPGSVWRVATSSYRGAHFATFPEQLVERPILASCPERVCVGCGQPWQGRYRRQNKLVRYRYRPACGCGAGFRPGLVLDPFFGSGTVGTVAKRFGRDWLGIELNRDYHALAWDRLEAVDGR